MFAHGAVSTGTTVQYLTINYSTQRLGCEKKNLLRLVQGPVLRFDTLHSNQ